MVEQGLGKVDMVIMEVLKPDMVDLVTAVEMGAAEDMGNDAQIHFIDFIKLKILSLIHKKYL